jgi:hypothetical protein
MRGRVDLAQHFFQSAYLASAIGANGAMAAGFSKELVDAQGLSGFSFGDIAADRAGIRFGTSVQKRRFPLGVLATSFDIDTFMPDIDKLPEGLSAGQFRKRFGKKDSPQVLDQLKAIDRRIDALPPYKPATLQLGP